MQETLVSPTAKLEISKLLESSPSPSPPARSTPSHPSVSRSFSVSATELDPRFSASPATSTALRLSAPTLPSGPPNAPRQSSTGGQAPLFLPATSSKRIASTSPQDSRHAGKKTRQWSKADSDELHDLRAKGEKWEDIAQRFPGRTSTACRLRYQNYLERKHEWTDKEKEDLARLYHRDNEQMWSGIAKELNIPWRAVEDMHWDLGRERMASLAGARILHSGRAGASGDPATSASPLQSAFPPGGPPTTQTAFVTTPAGSFLGPLPAPGGRLAQAQPPVTTNGTLAPGMVPGGEGRGFAPHRWNVPEHQPGSSRGPLPSLAEFEMGTPAYAAPGAGRHHDVGEEEDESDDGGFDERAERGESK